MFKHRRSRTSVQRSSSTELSQKKYISKASTTARIQSTKHTAPPAKTLPVIRQHLIDTILLQNLALAKKRINAETT